MKSRAIISTSVHGAVSADRAANHRARYFASVLARRQMDAYFGGPPAWGRYRRVCWDTAARTVRLRRRRPVGDLLAIYIAMWVVMARLERLGKQLEAVASVVREEIATAAERKQEIRDEWRYNGYKKPKTREGSGPFGE